jgi:hypothetical protein
MRFVEKMVRLNTSLYGMPRARGCIGASSRDVDGPGEDRTSGKTVLVIPRRSEDQVLIDLPIAAPLEVLIIDDKGA